MKSFMLINAYLFPTRPWLDFAFYVKKQTPNKTVKYSKSIGSRNPQYNSFSYKANFLNEVNLNEETNVCKSLISKPFH